MATPAWIPRATSLAVCLAPLIALVPRVGACGQRQAFLAHYAFHALVTFCISMAVKGFYEVWLFFSNRSHMGGFVGAAFGP